MSPRRTTEKGRSTDDHRLDATRLKKLLASSAPGFKASSGGSNGPRSGASRESSGRRPTDRAARRPKHERGPTRSRRSRRPPRSHARPGGSGIRLDEYNASRATEWRRLFGADTAYASRAALPLPCLLASGDNLKSSLAQLNRATEFLTVSARNGINGGTCRRSTRTTATTRSPAAPP